MAQQVNLELRDTLNGIIDGEFEEKLRKLRTAAEQCEDVAAQTGVKNFTDNAKAFKESTMELCKLFDSMLETVRAYAADLNEIAEMTGTV